ncbi:hypothetical protein B0H14DRAFT_2626188 [Mycena olivaceomarginata]|nr:hypothetical protein B0H14DRAFT_2626188 [Mycena olivaceomarginata]
MANAIAQDLLNSDSEIAPNEKKCKRKSGMKSNKNHDNSDPEDQDFTSGASGDDSDSDIEMIIPNEDLADSLPRKTIPENAKRQTAAKPTGKHTGPSAPPPGSEGGTADTGSVKSLGNAEAGPSRQPEPELKPKQQVYCLTAVNWVKRNAIYLFYSEVKTDATGASVEGSRYSNFFFGNGAILEMTKGSNYNTRSPQFRENFCECHGSPRTYSHTTATFVTVLRRVHKHNGFDFLVGLGAPGENANFFLCHSTPSQFAKTKVREWVSHVTGPAN